MLKLSNLESIGKPVYKFHNLHSVDFDGVDDFIELGEPISYTQHTISTWVKPSDNNTNSTILDARDASGDGIRLMLTSSEIVQYQLNSSTIDSSSAISVDEWHHIVGTYDGTTQKLYVDGSLVSSATTSQTISVTTNAQIGARNFSTRALEFLGKIDELAIFDRALTADEVTAIFRIKYGANLVQNGNFDELGSELVDNGDFSSDSDWDLDTGWSITNGKLRSDGTGNSGAEQTGVFNTSGKTFKITFDVNVDSGTLNSRVRFKGTGNTTISNITSAGSYTFYAVSVASQTALNFVTLSTNTAVYSIDNVSVKQVDPNDRFTLGTGFSFGDSKVIFSGTDYSSLTTTSNLLTSGKTYRVNLSATVTNGSFKLQNGGVDVITGSATNNYSAIFTSNSNTFNISRAGVGIQNDFTITNLMIEEQKYVATNLKLKSALFNPFTGSTLNLKNYYRFGDGILDTHPLICDMVEPSLGSELVTNGDFATDSDWTKGTGWSISNGVASCDGSQSSTSNFSQGNTFDTPPQTLNDIYKLTFDLVVTQGSITASSGSLSQSYTTSGSKILNGTPATGAGNLNFTASSTFIGSIDNVSVKQVNGVAGLMINMTEADITNDVPG